MILGVCFILALTLIFPSPSSAIPLNQMLKIAHRGASGLAPEHTMVSFDLAKKMDADYIELDLQTSKEGMLIVMHDPTVERTTDGTGAVNDLTLKQIKELDAGSWFNEEYPEHARDEYIGAKVPTLEEVFQRFGKNINYCIEIKEPELNQGIEKKLLDLIRTYGLEEQTIVQSFSEESLKKFHQMEAEVPLIQLISRPNLGRKAKKQLEAVQTYAIGVGVNMNRINEDYVKQVNKRGLRIHPYTINSKEDMSRMMDWGVTGIITNFPDRLNSWLNDN